VENLLVKKTIKKQPILPKQNRRLMRKKIVAGNWKMNLMPQEGAALISEVVSNLPAIGSHHNIIFCVSATHINNAKLALEATPNTSILLGAQNCSQHASGAFTGEISAQMLQHSGIQAVIIGHSERRQYFSETNEIIKQKVDAVLAVDLLPVFCCGESLDIRKANTQNQFVQQQLQDSLFHLSPDQIIQVVIAYEPIWAIGTGVTASTQQAQDMHAFIRSVLAEKYGASIANDISILYGGSCNATNAAELFSQADVDGGLIGGASLKAESFLQIISALN
jgi:triosephosphate isomerase (TIM)